MTDPITNIEADVLTGDVAIRSTYAHFIIFACAAFGLLWGGIQSVAIGNVKLDPNMIRPNADEEEKKDDHRELKDPNDESKGY